MQLRGPSPNLDLLRSVAVLLVLADHVSGTFGVAQRHKALFNAGGLGVLLFFVHTSCVLMMSLERMKFEGWRMYVAFYIRRLFRIYPLSTAVIAVVLIAGIPEASWYSGFEMPNKAAIVFNFLLVGNLTYTRPVQGPLWSLPYEVEMYAVLPFLFTLFRRDHSVKKLVFVWAGSVALALAQVKLAQIPGLGAGRLSLAGYAPCFVAGVVAYFLSIGTQTPKAPSWFWPCVLGAASVGYFGIMDSKPNGDVAAWLPIWIVCIFVGLTVPFCAEQTNQAVNTLSHLIAKYSYGLYLGQVPVLWFAFGRLRDASPWLQWAVFLTLIVLVPIASFHLIEDPFVKIGLKLSEAVKIPSTAKLVGVSAKS
jgi:peptidoglycan/LPS O-acetylase OafA/YrhL